MSRPTSKAWSTACFPGRLPPMTAMRILLRMSFTGVLRGAFSALFYHRPGGPERPCGGT